MNALRLAVVGSAGVIGRKHVGEIGQLDSAVLVGVNDVTAKAARQQAHEG